MEAFCTAGGRGNGNGGTGGKVTENGRNVIDAGRNGGNVSPRGLGIVIGGWRNGGNVSLGGLGMVNGNGGMVSGGSWWKLLQCTPATDNKYNSMRSSEFVLLRPC